jgi:hypothetical protein
MDDCACFKKTTMNIEMEPGLYQLDKLITPAVLRNLEDLSCGKDLSSLSSSSIIERLSIGSCFTLIECVGYGHDTSNGVIYKIVTCSGRVGYILIGDMTYDCYRKLA